MKKKCTMCGKDIEGNKKKKYCSKSCCDKAYQKKHKEKILKKRRDRWNDNSVEINQKRREFYNQNKDKINKKRKEIMTEKQKIQKNKTNKKYYEKKKLIIRQKQNFTYFIFNDFLRQNLICERCNVTYPENRLDFHHWNPKNKIKQISNMKNDDIINLWCELAKCIVVCQKCHSQIHKNMRTGGILLG